VFAALLQQLNADLAGELDGSGRFSEAPAS